MNLRTLTHVEVLYEIYAAARELPPEQRERVLHEHIGDAGDRQLLRELLQSELPTSWAAGLLELAWPEQAPPLQPGTTLGAFRIETLIGSGGQGRVYKARHADPAIDRAFALKLPHRLSAESLANLRHEARAVSTLEHPCIARFLYLDRTIDGQWFLVTEFVAGERIDQALAEATRPRILTLFAQLCDGLAHAHGQGVAHLDLKPSNVLVDAHGQPRILDFGLGLIQRGQAQESVRGYTRPYAAAEQVAGQPSQRSDIHALGVMLLQILTAATLELLPSRLQQLYAEEARAAGKRCFGADLYAVLRRACAAEPEQRYASAAQFGADLRALQKSEPVAAREWTWRYALRCLLRRRPWASAAAAAGVLLMALAIVALSLQRTSLAQAEALARSEAERARGSLRLLVSAMESADPESAPQVTPAMRALVERLRHAAAQSSDAQLRATADLVIARITRSTGDQPQALVQLNAVVERAQELSATDLLGQALLAKAEAHIELNQFDAAAQALQRLPPGTVPHAALRRAEGRRLLRMGDIGAAETPLREAIAEAGDDARLRIGAINDLGTVLLDRGRNAEALALYQEQQPQVQQFYGADSVAAGVNAQNRAAALLTLARGAEALDAVREAQRYYSAQLGADSVRNADALSLEAMIVLGDDPARALQCLQQARDSYRRIYGADSPRLAQTLYVLGEVHLSRGDATAALREFDAALLLVERLDASHPFVATLRYGKGSALVALNQPAQALVLLDAALQGMRQISTAPDTNKAQVLLTQSRAYRLLGRSADSDTASAQALQTALSTLPPQSLELAAFQLERAAAAATAGLRDEAELLLGAARAAYETQAVRPAAATLLPRLREAEQLLRDLK
ncbi:MAG: tetratricopeptide repeat protein [Rhodanobacteraceae bacterium]|nr:tetratricopeptide repeat protein [Rhodanobacteraceae bacterium]